MQWHFRRLCLLVMGIFFCFIPLYAQHYADTHSRPEPINPKPEEYFYWLWLSNVKIIETGDWYSVGDVVGLLSFYDSAKEKCSNPINIADNSDGYWEIPDNTEIVVPSKSIYISKRKWIKDGKVKFKIDFEDSNYFFDSHVFCTGKQEIDLMNAQWAEDNQACVNFVIDKGKGSEERALVCITRKHVSQLDADIRNTPQGHQKSLELIDVELGETVDSVWDIVWQGIHFDFSESGSGSLALAKAEENFAALALVRERILAFQEVSFFERLVERYHQYLNALSDSRLKYGYRLCTYAFLSGDKGIGCLRINLYSLEKK